MIRILLVDDHPAIVAAWTAAFDADPDMVVDAVARDVPSARDIVVSTDPFDVVVMDIRLGDESGFHLLRSLDLARTGVVIVSAHGSPAYVDAAQRLGVRGYFLKTSETAEIVAGVKRVAGGATALDPEAMRQSSAGR
jgi:DNA-binding NarL/FixJ family response regulator